MADSYYYQANGQPIGPLPLAALKQLANEGVIVASTPVRKGEQGAWYQAGTIAGLVPEPAEVGGSSGFETNAAGAKPRRAPRFPPCGSAGGSGRRAVVVPRPEIQPALRRN